MSHAEGHVGVRLGGAGDGIGELVQWRRLDLGQLASLDIQVEAPDVVLVPGHLVDSHPERRDLDADLRPFVLVSIGLACRAAHQHFAGGNRSHPELGRRTGDRLGIGLHLRGGLGFGLFGRQRSSGKERGGRRQDQQRR